MRSVADDFAANHDRANLPMIDSDLLLEAYRLGVFPMAMDNGEIRWFSPEPRTILPLDAFHVPHGLKRERKTLAIEIRIDTRFADVMRECAARPDTWINDEIIESYTRLHELGHAHSVEAWSVNELVGGLYGVAIGGAFFGESMFHRATGASKIALWALVDRLRERRFALLDTQWLTPHLKQFGAREIPRQLYLHLLNAAIDLPRTFVDD
jgi:leucyl/phenylalanyl-tRNA---protein transferase